MSRVEDAYPGDLVVPAADMRRTWRNVIVLVVAQAILGAQMSAQFISGGLVGQTLAWTPCLATLPLSMLILGSTLSARPLAAFMARRGRRAGFVLASVVAGLGAVLSTAGLRYGSFLLFMIGTGMGGCYMAAQGFFRFAATDNAPVAMQPKVISMVLAGGLLSALTGPAIVRATNDLLAVPFLATYGAIILLNLAGPLVFAFLDIPLRPPANRPAASAPRRSLWRTPEIAVAIICGLVAYALMNLVMTSTPLAMVGCGFSNNTVASVVSGHVLAMYAPSFVTGHLIARFGPSRIVALGLAILAGAGLVALSSVTLSNFVVALILLGIGWNFGYIGATAMLTRAQDPADRERVQGINDAFVFGGVFVASLSSGGLLNCSGGSITAGWNAVNIAMLPFLLLAGVALIWLAMRRPRFA